VPYTSERERQTDVSEEHIASIFRVGKAKKNQQKFGGKALSYSLRTLRMDGECSSETSVDFKRTTRRYIKYDTILHNHRYENLKFYNV
jgi:hypothetical protein